MSTQKLTLRSEIATRSSDQIMVLSAKQISNNIYPGEIFLANNKHINFKSTAGVDDAYIFRYTDDTLYIANLKAREEIIIVVTMASTNQRTLRLREDAETNNLMLQFGYDTVIKTDNGNIELRPADHVIITDMATSDPHVLGALWNSSGTVKISAG